MSLPKKVIPEFEIVKDYQRLIASRSMEGSIIWQSDFAKALEFAQVNPSGYESGIISRSSVAGYPCMVLKPTTNNEMFAQILLAKPPAGQRRIGVEFYFGTTYTNYQLTDMEIQVGMEDYAASSRVEGAVVIYQPTGAGRLIGYKNQGGSYPSFESNLEKTTPIVPIARGGVGWNYLKAVFDFDTSKYASYAYNENSWDLSSYPLRTGIANLGNRSLSVGIGWAYPTSLYPVFIRDVIVTRCEP